MEDFNSQYANHSKLEQLKQFILEHGTYIELKKGEQFTIQGKVNHRGAYIEHGLLRYTRVDEKGNIHIVGYTFSGEFTGSLCTLIEPNQPSLVTIEAVCDTKICYIPYLKISNKSAFLESENGKRIYEFENPDHILFLAEHSYYLKQRTPINGYSLLQSYYK